MAKLPGYDSSQQMSTEPSTQMRDMAQEQQMGKNISGMGKVATDVATVWQEAEDAATTLNRQNFMDEAQRDIFNRAQKDPDYANSTTYHEDLEKVREGSLEGFTNNEARAKFAITSSNQTAAANIKIDGLFRTKFQQFYQGEIITSHEKNKKEFIAGGGQAAKDKQIAAVQEAFDKGAVSAVYVANELAKIDDWDNLRYLQMAQEGQIREALEMIDSSDMQPSEKSAAKQSILTMAAQGAIIAKVEQLNLEQAMYAETDAVLDDPEKSYVEKMDFLEQQKKFGLNDKDAKDLEKSLNSSDKIEAESHSESKAMVVLAIAGLQNGITDKKDGMKDISEYLQGVKATRQMITDLHTNGRITKADKDGFIQKLNTTVKEEKNIAANKIAKQKLAIWPLSYVVYGMDDAYKDMKEYLKVPHLAAEALLDLESELNSYDPTAGSKDKFISVKDRTMNIIDKYESKMADNVRRSMREDKGLAPKAPLSDAEVLKEAGASMADVEAAAAKHGVTPEEVIRRMRK